MTIFLSSEIEDEQLVVNDPQQLSKGYRRSILLRSGIQLLIQEYDLQDHLVLKNPRLSLEANLEKIEAIAHTVGYANRSRFACAFRKKYGVNPSEYKLSSQRSVAIQIR